MSDTPLNQEYEIHSALLGARAVLFDFDFTLADSSVGIIACINYGLTRLGLPAAAPEEILKTVGLYIPEALVALVGEEYRPRGPEFFSYFTEKADEVMEDGTKLYPATSKVISALDRLGYVLGIVSTKYRYRIESLMDRDGLLGNLSVIIGGEDVLHHKPNPEGLTLAAGRLGVGIEECVYVGDSHVDAGAARSAGMPFVAVLSGTTTSEVLSEYPTKAVVPAIDELVREKVC